VLIDLYKCIGICPQSSQLVGMTADYSNSLWMPGFYTFHVYFLYHLTWCRAFFRKSCTAICPLVSIPEHARSFYNFYHLQDKIIQTSRFCQIWQINNKLKQFLHQIYYFTLSNAKSLCFTICLMKDNFIC
jgi:hypothetical protein